MGKVENILGLFTDIMKPIRALIFNKEYESVKAEALEKARDKLNYVKSFVGDKEFALGYLTIVDFYLADYLYTFEFLYPS